MAADAAASGDPPDDVGPGFEPLPRARPRRGLRLIAVMAVAAGAAGAGWYYVDGDILAPRQAEIPLLRAEKAPVKVRPDSPGGLQVPDQDKKVYGLMRGEGEGAQPESLLPPLETPLEPPSRRAPSAPEAAVPAPQAKVPTPDEVVAATPPTPPPAAPKPLSEPRTALSAAAPAKAAAAKGYEIQLAAVRSLGRAKDEWERLRKTHPDLLGALELSVTKADLGPKKGVFYRLRAGPIGDEKGARALCARLVKRRVGCLVVRP